MKPSLMVMIVLIPLVLAGCDSSPQTAPKTDAAQAAPDTQVAPGTPRPAAPKAVVTSGSGPSTEPPSAGQTPMQVRKALDANRGLMNQTMAYMDQNRFDLAEQNLRELKARRDSLPEFLQIQVDRLEVLVKTGASSEPQRSLKAAIMESEAQEARR